MDKIGNKIHRLRYENWRLRSENAQLIAELHIAKRNNMDNKQESTHDESYDLFTEEAFLEFLGVPVREPQIAEEVDACLRYYGYDPEKVGYTGKVFAEICIENVKLRDALQTTKDVLSKLWPYFRYRGVVMQFSPSDYFYLGDIIRLALFGKEEK